jgi:uncharacterized membrane protein
VHDFAPPERGGRTPRPRCNMSDADRLGSVIGGAALTLYGLSKWRRGGWILAGFGVLLVRRGATGHCFTYELLGLHADRSPDHLS